eukprot:g7008.t1
MLNSLFILNNAGEVLIEKHWRGITGRRVTDFFWEQVCKCDSKEDVLPVMSSGKFYLTNVFRDSLFIVAVMTQELAPLWTIEFMHRVADIFVEYFGAFDETLLKENFSTVYQVLEEMNDHGYALTTEPNALKAMIPPPSLMGKVTGAITGAGGHADVLPDGFISSMPWRKAGVRYTQNEIYFDIEEVCDAIIESDGQMVACEVSGRITCNSRLSGVPDLTLVFTDPSVLDDCSFHPCVRYSRYERDRVVSFVPPDGVFELMKYRVQVPKIVLPLYVEPRLNYHQDRGTVSVMVGEQSMPTLTCAQKGGPSVEDVVITIPFAKGVRTVDIEANVGKHLWDQGARAATWSLGKLPGAAKAKSPNLTGKLHLVSADEHPEEKEPFLLKYKVPNSTVSGLAVETLMLTNERYKPYKGVKCTVFAGKIQFRLA